MPVPSTLKLGVPPRAPVSVLRQVVLQPGVGKLGLLAAVGPTGGALGGLGKSAASAEALYSLQSTVAMGGRAVQHH